MDSAELNLEESDTIEKNKVLLNREWSFWENYETRSKNDKDADYSKLLKELFSFNDIISFWQFWNNYPGSELKKYFLTANFSAFFLRRSTES